MRDGSGLSRYDFVTPEALVAISTHVDRDARLQRAVRGVAADRGPGRHAGGSHEGDGGRRQRAREDRIDVERAALSGYVTTADGEPLVFSILANNFETPADVVNAAEDASSSAGEVPAAVTGRVGQ